MPTFKYKARGTRGDAVEGTIEANSSDGAASRLIESGLTPIDIQVFVEQASMDIALNSLFRPKVESSDLIQFSRQMHCMLRAGIPLFRTVKALSDTTNNITMANTLREVNTVLESGRTLSEALSQHQKVFSVFYVSLVRVGETTGKLPEIFKQLAFYLDRDNAARTKIKSALRYPSFVLSAIMVAIMIMSIWVIPAFSNMFDRFGAELPLPTRILMVISEFMVAYWHVVLVALGLLIYGWHIYIQSDAGRYRWDKIMLRLPLVGSVIYQASLARFSHLFAISINSGVPLITSLTVVAQALNNKFLEDRLLGMREGIEQGKALSLTATGAGVFDPLVLQMLAVGEETGTIGELLAEVADYYEREVDYAADRLSSAIEPIMTAVIGGLVLIMAMGIFLPMWDLASVALH